VTPEINETLLQIGQTLNLALGEVKKKNKAIITGLKIQFILATFNGSIMLSCVHSFSVTSSAIMPSPSPVVYCLMILPHPIVEEDCSAPSSRFLETLSPLLQGRVADSKGNISRIECICSSHLSMNGISGSR